MFGLGMGEIILIAVVALIALGPDKLPQAAKSLSKGIRDLRRSTRDLRSSIEQDTELGDAVREIRSALQDDPVRPAPATKPVAAADTHARGEKTDIPTSKDDLLQEVEPPQSNE